ncbi:hypothetical protein BKP35_12210 [Anaerobacillus arseniciselenatis]|uniref:Uncharacterized protein n=1 Tax=Anaerobacillus arseniciselenatis TaxID=85682 RepID=A0A1S2LH10_9BACI|nr:hypothetical protein [Anaerobacillus arseniciselenatis]OIJ11500.1 hypothetical protein BKP35_12210 [Anaerobacillus arseniciselenatis]
MNALLLCDCYGMDPCCSKCSGHEKIEVTQTYRIPSHFDFATLKFEPIGGLFQIFHSGEQIIGVGNIDYQPESKSYYVDELQSFWGQGGHEFMINTMLSADDIEFIEGNFKWEDCL